MTFIIFVIVLAIAIFVILYRRNKKTNVYRFLNMLLIHLKLPERK